MWRAATAIKLFRSTVAPSPLSPEDIAMYFEDCLGETGDHDAFLAKALGSIARAHGMTQLATDTPLGRESLYKAMSGDGNPYFETI